MHDFFQFLPVDFLHYGFDFFLMIGRSFFKPDRGGYFPVGSSSLGAELLVDTWLFVPEARVCLKPEYVFLARLTAGYWNLMSFSVVSLTEDSLVLVNEDGEKINFKSSEGEDGGDLPPVGDKSLLVGKWGFAGVVWLEYTDDSVYLYDQFG